MGSIDEPPAILGGMIGSALVGTFLGVLLAYGIVGPLASRLKQVLEHDEQIFHAVKQVIIASLHGHPQPLVVESARSGLGDAVRPGLTELLDSLRGRWTWPAFRRAATSPARSSSRKSSSRAATGTMAARGRWPMPTS
jgi:chemotaxis protein MotA